jgi:hypothetical protein
MIPKSFLLAALVVANAQAATTYTWNGSASLLWSNSANWSPNGVPQSGDTLVFDTSAANASTNDLPPGTDLRLVVSTRHTFGGGELTSSSITGAYGVFALRLKAAPNAVMDVDLISGGLDVGANSIALRAFGIYSPIFGSGSITLDGWPSIQDTVTLNAASTFSGSITGSVTVAAGNAVLPGSLNVSHLRAVGSTLGAVRVVGSLEVMTSATQMTRLELSEGAIFRMRLPEQPLLIVNGPVDLTGAGPLQWISGRPRPTSTYTILRNDGAGPVTGTFASLPEGAVLDIGARDRARISYAGGDGNDITLKTVPDMHKPPLDLNFDGRTDLTWWNAASGVVYHQITTSTGLGKQGEGPVYQEPDTQWRILGDGDFNGDGVSDLAWRHAATGAVYIQLYAQNRSPIGGAIVHVEPDAAWQIVATPDMDGDGRSDLLWHNVSTGVVYVMLLNGAAIATQGVAYVEPNTAWQVAATGDFAGSGKANQVVWRNAVNGQVYLQTLLHQGGGAFAASGSVIHVEADPAWTLVGAGDFDGDHRSDLAWFNTSTRQLYGMLMDGATIKSQGTMHVAEAGWGIAGLGNFNGDARTDVSWRHHTDGRIHVQLMNGLAIQAQGLLHAEPDPQWRLLGLAHYRAMRGGLQ